MEFDEFEVWLREELQEGRLLESQLVDLLEQRRTFDEARSFLESEFRRSVVGFVANERRSATSVTELLDFASHEFPGRMLYFELIGHPLVEETE